ncbi:MAG: hypothetical protein R3Y11_04815 [Pseudomonadota bacterium]
MKKFMFACFVALMLVSSGMFATNAHAIGKGVVFVDANELMTKSKPGKVAQKYLAEVKTVLQGAFDQVVAINEKKQKTLTGEEAKNFNPQPEIQRAQGMLQQQLQGYINEINVRMSLLIQEASEKWLKRNSDYMAVVPKNNAFATNKKADVTSKIMDYLDDLKIELPELPKVVVEENKK